MNKLNELPVLVTKIVEGIQEKKGHKIAIIDMRGLEVQPCAFFVIAEGTSNTHVNAIADEVEDYVRKAIKEKPANTIGHENAAWIAMDYGNVIVHVFQREARDFYDIEQLWADGETFLIDDF